MSPKPQFRVAFNGETEYTWRGKTYCCRHAYSSCACDNDEHNQRIGCVWFYGSSEDYPPAELMEHFPGYVRARYKPLPETYEVETTCGVIVVHKHVWEFEETPRVIQQQHGLFAVAWLEELQRHGVAV